MNLNNKGFAITSIIYSMLILFLTLVVLIISNLASRNAIFDQQKEDILDKIGQNNPFTNEYQEVEYIESTGTQWIDTGVKSSEKLKFSFDIEYTKIIQNQHFGYGGGNVPSRLLFGINISSNFFCSATTTTVPANTNRNIWELDTQNSLVRIIDSSSKNVIFTNDNFTLPTDYQYNLILFSGYISGSNYKYPSNYKLYSAKIYNENSLIRDLVPCYRKLDNEIGLYDLVNGDFYTNSGTGTFNKGVDV